MANRKEQSINKYSKALFEAVDFNEQSQVLTNIKDFLNILNENDILKNSISSPLIKVEDKQNVITAILEKLKYDPKTNNIIKLLTQNSKIELLEDIYEKFEALNLNLKSLTNLNITTAFEISDDEKNQLIQKLNTELKTDCNINWEIDNKILGGIVVEAGDLVLDNSIKGSLEKFKQQFIN